jgi:hypothetical protein
MFNMLRFLISLFLDLERGKRRLRNANFSRYPLYDPSEGLAMFMLTTGLELGAFLS